MHSARQFSQLILAWYDAHGRHDLPWQKNKTPYRVWVSEIMLQQTQVKTVIPFYRKFMRSFPSLKSLAQAPIDDVLSHWSGLGYYSRARNLHKTAEIISSQYKGRFPKTLEALESLPGIGRSTAGAILSLAMQTPATILDGNVVRVLARYSAQAGWPGDSAVRKQLWQIAAYFTPTTRCGDYNQAMMDLGSMTCARSKPSCQNCPINEGCEAYHDQTTHLFPEKKAKLKRPQKQVFMLVCENQHGEILLLKRPPSGIWGSLWSFPECDDEKAIKMLCQQRFHCQLLEHTFLPKFKHVFSHFELLISPIKLSVKSRMARAMDSNTQVWYNSSNVLPGGIPAPVEKLLQIINVH